MELWDKIRQRTKFEMKIDSDKLVELAIEEIKKMVYIKPIEVASFKADIDISNQGVEIDEKSIHSSILNIDVSHLYELPDPISEL